MPFRFRIERRAGEGASATVFRARDSETGLVVALKVGHDVGERQRLADEAELLALTDSESIAGVVDAGFIPAAVPELQAGLPYLALTWAGGDPLDVRGLADGERESVALAVARDLGKALAALHAMGIAHGDIKPSNVVLVDQTTTRARAVLVDLGLGAAADELMPRGGTRRYLAPETFEAATSGDARARDLWALGLLLAEIGSQTVAVASDPAEAAAVPGLPPALERIVRALLARSPGARPSAEWVGRTARDALPSVEDGAERIAERRSAVRHSYLGVRREELLRSARGRRLDIRVDGAPGAWLESASALLTRIATLRGIEPEGERDVVRDLDALGRARWLTSLVGSIAARWPAPPLALDSDLAERLLACVERLAPRSITLASLESGTNAGVETPSNDPVTLGIALGNRAPSAEVLDAAERVVGGDRGQVALGLALGRALRRRGELGRAMAVLGRIADPEATVEAAECARRAGAFDRVESLLLDVDTGLLAPRVRARVDATVARVELDRGRIDVATSMAEKAAPTSAVLEVRALAAMTRGELELSRTIAERARAVAETDEERARADAIVGNVAHALGDSGRALDAFRSAADHATRAGAVLEEATYFTGVAAAGFDAGRLGESLEAATRATLLFEHLGRFPEAARALLARAAVFAAAGSAALAREAAEQAIFRARTAGDVRCRAFGHLVLADVHADGDADAAEHARCAATLLEGAAPGDRLRAAARRHAYGDQFEIEEFDKIAEEPSAGVPARLEWWSARAEILSRAKSPDRADRVLAALGSLASLPGPVSSRGEAFAAGASLAARVGDGEGARRFAVISIDAARTLREGAPPELRLGLGALPWTVRVRSPRETAVLPEQIADIESLVRSLGTRDRLRPLLDQALDALVLWTGVERGLLLLRAPGNRLVPRAARNIAREDLTGAQLELSRSLAERALRTGDTVVAVDATGELPEVHASVHALKLRSVLAVPLLARGEALGVVYLDDRVRRGAFGPGELAWVRLVAALAAVAIADAKVQLALRRTARRAKRAEERLALTLAHREAELDVTARELARIREERATRYTYDGIIGESPEVRGLLALVDRVTPTEVPVLIAGESGSGKELVARAIHKNGPRGKGPFVTENCGAIPESLLESTLFGHVRGAFTGANRPHAGLFEVAHGGTLFLDEIGEMSLGMQTKLLRVLEEGEIRPVGSERTRMVDVRIIAASHRDLSAMTETGAFRRDLFYRLNVIRIDVPPLRARKGDVEILVRHFLARHEANRKVRLSRAALDALSAFSWPGNIRQLENEVRRALVLADDTILPEHLSAETRQAGTAEVERNDGLNVRRRVDLLEAELVRVALERTSGNQTRAAELLGLSRFGLQKMIRRLGIELPSVSGQA